MPNAVEMVPLSLSNLLDGKAEEQFQEALLDVSDVFQNADRYERGKDDVTRCQVLLEIDVEYQPGRGMVSVDGRIRVKRPKARRHGRSVFYKPGEFTVAATKQVDLPFAAPAKVSHLRPASAAPEHEEDSES